MKIHKFDLPSLDGAQWNNRGGKCEIALKRYLGYECDKVAPRGHYDIEDLRAEVKSADSTLLDRRIGDTLEQSINNYFNLVDIDKWFYMNIKGNECIAFEMNAREWYAFLCEFTRYDHSRGTVRIATLSRRMRKWVECPQCASDIIVLE